MLEQLFGAALIGIGALTIYARLMGRSIDAHPTLDDRGSHVPPRGR